MMSDVNGPMEGQWNPNWDLNCDKYNLPVYK